MSAPIVLGLPPEDVDLVLDMLLDARRLYRTTYPIRHDKIREAIRLYVEIERQNTACRKAMRDGNYE